MDNLAQRYMGKEKHPWHKQDEKRVIVKVEREKTSERG